jgi:hypothetical protein
MFAVVKLLVENPELFVNSLLEEAGRLALYVSFYSALARSGSDLTEIDVLLIMTNPMVQGPSAGQEILRSFGNWNIHYRGHKSTPLDS